MKIFRIGANIPFGRLRQDRNTVEQLKHDNAYDLNLPNQRRISNAIDELGKVPGEENIDFLLDVSKNLRYGTNIDLGKKPYNDWRDKLNTAVKSALNLSDKSVQERLSEKISSAINSSKKITPEEEEILSFRNELLSKINLDELAKIKDSNAKQVQRNLNYFVISSEVPIAQKIYILKRLNYLMSDDYKINPQLKDKKTQVLAEILNDIVVDTPESKIPNIKAINQKQHGMCVAISICRKALAYEDKQNYVDMVLTELDDSDYMQVYDRANLGKHKKVPLPKANIDYDYALQKGYRIVDASAMNWMNAADTVGAFNDVIGAYSPLDKENFGTFADTHIHKDINDKSEKYQDYYRSCKKAKDAVVACKKKIEKDKYYRSVKSVSDSKKISVSEDNTSLMQSILKNASPDLERNDLRKILAGLKSLVLDNSDAKAKLKEPEKSYSFITNEDQDYKAEKVIGYLNKVLPENSNIVFLKTKSQDLVDLIEEIHGVNSGSKSMRAKYMENVALFNAAAAYRTMYSFALDIPEYLTDLMIELNIPDNETLIIKNLQTLSKNIRSGKINPELKEKLHESFKKDVAEKQSVEGTKKSDELLAEVLDEYASSVSLFATTFADDIYASLLLNNRKQVLATELESISNEIKSAHDKDLVKRVAEKLNIKNYDKNSLLKTIDGYLDLLDNPNTTDEQYNKLMNKTGHKSILLDLKDSIDSTYGLIFKDQNKDYIAGFNLVNGAEENAPFETTQDLYQNIAVSFNNVSRFLKTLQDSLQVKSEDGTLLNTADPKFEVLKRLENMGEIPSEKELTSLRNKFDNFYKNRYAEDGTTIKFKDLPKSVKTFTPSEKEALNKYKNNINFWYTTSLRRLNEIYIQIKEPLEELNREIGVQKGENWTSENSSGLMDNQALKIFEHMTDRPYYAEKDIRNAIDKIKKSPYSGTSMTSVKNDEPAMHAQYVADVKPILLQSGDSHKIKNVIFHDNSWGASEHENVWTDKQGFLRTDYSNEYGGEYGYITNDKYLNGKLEDNFVDKSGKYVPQKSPSKRYNKLVNDSSEEYTFPMAKSFILQGKAPDAMSTVKTIKQELLLPSSGYVDELTKHASNMTRDELKSAIKRIRTAGETSRKLYRLLIKRIVGTGVFDQGIDSEEKYYKLSPNDKLRLIAEKVAIIRSYDDIPDINTYNIEVKSQKDLDILHKKLSVEARNNFDYVMAKNPDILKYAAESSRNSIYKELKQFSTDNNIKLTSDTMAKVVNSMKLNKDNVYNGSISQGIDVMLNNFKKYLKTKTNVQDEKIKALSDRLRPVLENNLIITENDVKTKFLSGRNEKIAQWIDREFSPASDKEFAQILNNIRNMTTEDFKNNYDSKISDSDMGIKNITGYDIIKLIRSGNESAKNSFINTVFYESYYKDIDESKTTPYYDYKKLSRKLSGGRYVGGKRSFDDLYSEFYYNFLELTIKKEFNKYKDEAFRKYFVFPAYPVVEISTPEDIDASLSTFKEKLDNYMEYIFAYKTQDISLQLVTALKKYSDTQLPKSGNLDNKQYSTVLKHINRLIDWNAGDETINEKKAEAAAIINSGTKDVEVFRKYIDSIYEFIKAYEKTGDGKTMKEAQKIMLQSIDMYKKTYVMSLFEPKYQGKALELINKWISAKSKAVWVKDHFNVTLTEDSSDVAKNIADKYIQNVESTEQIFEQFKDLFMKHRILDTPEKFMNEYLLLCTKDAKHPDQRYSNSSEESKKAIEDLKQTFKTNLEGLLYKADMMKLQYILMDCANKGNLNAVSDALRSSTLELKDGSVVSLDSDEGLNLIISPMLSEENLDTAALFLNQLGLSEKVARMVSDQSSLDVAYKSYKRIQNILKSTDAQAKFVKDELLKIGNIDEDPNYLEKIEVLKQKIIDKCKKTSYRSSIEVFESAFNDIINDINSQPNQSKTFLLKTNISYAISGLREIVKANINYLNQPLQIIQKRYDLLQKLLLPDNSPVAQDAENYLNSIRDLLEYEHSTQKSFPNIGISSM